MNSGQFNSDAEGALDSPCRPEAYLLKFGKNVKKERILAGWQHQYNFEEDSGLGKSVLSRIENKGKGLSGDSITLICNFLNRRPDALLEFPAWTVPEGAPSNGKGIYWKDEIGPRVQFSREHRKLSQPQLAALTGLSQGMISNIENATRFPSAETLVALCIALEVPASFLLGFPHRGAAGPVS